MIFPKKCLGYPSFLGYIWWPKVVGALLLLSAPLALLCFRRPWPDLCFSGGKIISEESRGTKSKSLCHTLYYQNQMDNLFPETALSGMSQRSGCSSIKISGDLSFATKKIQQNRLQKHFLRSGKKLASSYPAVAFATPCHPMATVLWRRKISTNIWIYSFHFRMKLHLIM